jgi:hypothetical protein
MCANNVKSDCNLEMTKTVHGKSHNIRTLTFQGLCLTCLPDRVTVHCCTVADTKMAQCAPLILRLVASSITAVNRAGKIIRDIISQGDLGIVEKVRLPSLGEITHRYIFTG